MKIRCGDIRITKSERCWRTCDSCGLPAKYRVTYLFKNARSDPQSNAYGEDDCSWCSDEESYFCSEHVLLGERQVPMNMRHCATFPLAKFRHFGWYWREISKEVIHKGD